MTRTGLTLTLYRCDESDVRAVLDVLDELGVEHDGPRDAVVLGSPTPYQAGEVSGDLSDQVAEQLEARVPDVWFDVATDATGEYLGAGHVRTHGRTLSYEAGPEGDPVWSLPQLLQVRRAGDVVGALDELTGMQRFADLGEESKHLGKLDETARTVPLPLCPECEIRTRCSCEEDAEDEAYAMNDAIDRMPALV